MIEELIRKTVQDILKECLADTLKFNTQTKNQDQLLSTAEVARILSIDYAELLSKKDILGLKYIKIGSHYKFSEKALFKWIENNSSECKEFKFLN